MTEIKSGDVDSVNIFNDQMITFKIGKKTRKPKHSKARERIEATKPFFNFLHGVN